MTPEPAQPAKAWLDDPASLESGEPAPSSGYVLIPAEPTEAMIEAVWKATLGGSMLAAERAARAMIAAAIKAQNNDR